MELTFDDLPELTIDVEEEAPAAPREAPPAPAVPLAWTAPQGHAPLRFHAAFATDAELARALGGEARELALSGARRLPLGLDVALSVSSPGLEGWLTVRARVARSDEAALRLTLAPSPEAATRLERLVSAQLSAGDWVRRLFRREPPAPVHARLTQVVVAAAVLDQKVVADGLVELGAQKGVYVDDSLDAPAPDVVVADVANLSVVAQRWPRAALVLVTRPNAEFVGTRAAGQLLVAATVPLVPARILEAVERVGRRARWVRRADRAA